MILRGNTWHIRKVIKGVTLAESTHTGNRRLAEQIMAKRITELTTELVLAGKKPIKLHDAIDLFVKSRSHLPSAQSCEIHLRYFKACPNHYLDRITDSDLDAVISARRAEGYAESTLKVSVTYFNALLNYCAEKGYTVRKKMKPIKHDSGKIRWLTKDELAKFFAALDPDLTTDEVTKAQKQENYDLARLLYATGTRYSEIAEMTWNQVNFDAGTIYIKRKKGSISGTIGMTADAREVFMRRRLMEKGDHVFATKQRQHNETRWVKAAVKRAGLSEVDGTVTLHTLRHSCAVHLLQAGMNLLEVKEFLGHKTIQSTMVYVHVIQSDVTKKAATLLDALAPVRVPVVPSVKLPKERKLSLVK